MNATISSPASTADATPTSAVIRTMGIGAAVATAATTLTFLAVEAATDGLLVAGADGGPPESPMVGFVIGGTIFFGIIATLFALVLRRFAPSPAKVFSAAAVVFLVAYGAFAWSAAENTSTGIWLNVLHVVGAIPLVGAALRSLSSSTSTA